MNMRLSKKKLAINIVLCFILLLFTNITLISYSLTFSGDPAHEIPGGILFEQTPIPYIFFNVLVVLISVLKGYCLVKQNIKLKQISRYLIGILIGLLAILWTLIIVYGM